MRDKSKKDTIAMLLGREIRNFREKFNLSQLDVAKSWNKAAAQLCKIESGKNIPSDRTLRSLAPHLRLHPEALVELKNRIAKCVEDEIMDEMDRLNYQKKTNQPIKVSNITLRPIRKDVSLTNDSLDNLTKTLQKYRTCEIHCGIEPLKNPFGSKPIKETEEAFIEAAEKLRARIGSETLPIQLLIPELESLGIRIVYDKDLSKEHKSVGYYDEGVKTFVYVINSSIPFESQVYELVSEIAWSVLFVSNGFNMVPYTEERGVLVRAFTSIFLLPTKAIADLFLRLNLSNNDWTIDLICLLKQRFGVSALVFLWRLTTIGFNNKPLIASSKFNELRDELKDYAEKHPNAREPHPITNQGTQSSWLETLRIRAGF